MPASAAEVRAKDRVLAAIVWGGIFFGLLGAVQGWRARGEAPFAPILGRHLAIGAALAAALLVPALGARVYLWILRVFGVVGWIVGHVLMTLIFYTVITPIGALLRATGKTSIDRRFKRGDAPRWTPHDRPAEARRYYRMF
jgi:hypothetical protein